MRLTAGELADRLAAGDGARRRIVGVAGPPGSGKSALAEWLVTRLPAAAVLPMDGYHYDDLVLGPRGDLPRKGAPHTFDVDGLGATLARLAADDGRPVAVPVFDRTLEIARAGARIIAADVRLVIAEGNYLLLEAPGWADLAPLFDLTVMVAAGEAELARRLRARWAGLAADEARAKVEDNDLPNGLLVLRESRPADVTVAAEAPFA